MDTIVTVHMIGVIKKVFAQWYLVMENVIQNVIIVVVVGMVETATKRRVLG